MITINREDLEEARNNVSNDTGVERRGIVQMIMGNNRSVVKQRREEMEMMRRKGRGRIIMYAQ